MPVYYKYFLRHFITVFTGFPVKPLLKVFITLQGDAWMQPENFKLFTRTLSQITGKNSEYRDQISRWKTLKGLLTFREIQTHVFWVKRWDFTLVRGRERDNYRSVEHDSSRGSICKYSTFTNQSFIFWNHAPDSSLVGRSRFSNHANQPAWFRLWQFNALLLCHLNVLHYLLVYLLVHVLVSRGRYRVVRR